MGPLSIHTHGFKAGKMLKLPVCSSVSPCKKRNFGLCALGPWGFPLLLVAPWGVRAPMPAAAVVGADLARLRRSGDG